MSVEAPLSIITIFSQTFNPGSERTLRSYRLIIFQFKTSVHIDWVLGSILDTSLTEWTDPKTNEWTFYCCRTGCLDGRLVVVVPEPSETTRGSRTNCGVLLQRGKSRTNKSLIGYGRRTFGVESSRGCQTVPSMFPLSFVPFLVPERFVKEMRESPIRKRPALTQRRYQG